MRILTQLVAYCCVATVLTAVGAYGYLRQSGRLDDEKLFRMMAIFHEVDLDELDNRKSAEETETPPEELSYEQQQKQLRVATLQFDAKRKELSDSLEAFQFRFAQLNDRTEKYNRLADKVQEFLKNENEKVMDQALKKVRDQLQMLIPKKQAKPILVKMISRGEVDHVIDLLTGLSPRSRQAILKTFDTEEDILMLDQLTQRMLAGDPAKPFIDDQLRELEELKSQDK